MESFWRVPPMERVTGVWPRGAYERPRTLDGLLRREAPALEVVAHGTDAQGDAASLLDELHHCAARPQGEVHLELLRPLVADGAAHQVFLLGAEAAAVARVAAARSRPDGRRAAGLVVVNGLAYCRIAEPTELDDVHHTVAGLVQSNHLFAALVLLVWGEVAGVFFVHHSMMAVSR